MRFVVFGAGAIGGRRRAPACSRAGFDVTLVARGAHGRALQSGLVLEAPDETVTLPIPVVADPARVSWDGGRDGDTGRAARREGPAHRGGADPAGAVAPPATPVVCMQNGVENERRVLRRFPHTYAMCVMCPASHLRPGCRAAPFGPGLRPARPGSLPLRRRRRGQAIADAIATTTFQSVARPDIMRWKYRKLLMNLANAVEALGGPEGRVSALAREAQREGEEALAAAGIAVASSEEDRERRGDLLQMAPHVVGGVAGGLELAEPGPRDGVDRGGVPQRRDRAAGRRSTACRPR